MNEAPLPGQSSVPASLPPPPPRPSAVGAGRGRGRLRASLEACTAEGLAAEVVGASLGNAAVAAWSVALGASPLLLGALWALPWLGHVLQLPASWITARFGRKRVCVVANGISRQIVLPAAVLPFVDIGVDAKRAILVVLVALAALAAGVGHNAWLAWMGELVPARIRGAYFGRRAAWCSVVATAAAIAIASALDAGSARGALGAVLAAILVLRSIFGAATTVFMLRQHDPHAPNALPRLSDVVVPFRDRADRSILTYRAAWSVATGLGASVSVVFMLRALGLGFTAVAAYSAIVAALRLVTTPMWGRALDRSGARMVLVVSSLGAAASSFAWVGATRGTAWVVGLDALVSGLVLGGQELAAFTLPLAFAPSARRPVYAAANVMTGGVAYGLASLAGGALAGVVAATTLLLASALLRVVATALATQCGETRTPRSSFEERGDSGDAGAV